MTPILVVLGYHGCMSHEDELYDLLKQGSDAGTTLPNNENQSVAGSLSLYEDPEGQAPAGSAGASWGKDGPPGVYHSPSAREEATKGREKLLDRAFSAGANSNGGAERKLIAQSFERGKSGDFSTHSLGLGGKIPEKVASARTQSFMERVRSLVGRT